MYTQTQNEEHLRAHELIRVDTVWAPVTAVKSLFADESKGGKREKKEGTLNDI